MLFSEEINSSWKELGNLYELNTYIYACLWKEKKKKGKFGGSDSCTIILEVKKLPQIMCKKSG